jgi:hypothetical protein
MVFSSFRYKPDNKKAPQRGRLGYFVNWLVRVSFSSEQQDRYINRPVEPQPELWQGFQ